MKGSNFFRNYTYIVIEINGRIFSTVTIPGHWSNFILFVTSPKTCDFRCNMSQGIPIRLMYVYRVIAYFTSQGWPFLKSAFICFVAKTRFPHFITFSHYPSYTVTKESRWTQMLRFKMSYLCLTRFHLLREMKFWPEAVSKIRANR